MGCGLALNVLNQLSIHHGVEVQRHLLVKRGSDGWVTVAKAGHTNATDSVKQFTSSLKVNPRTFALYDFQT